MVAARHEPAHYEPMPVIGNRQNGARVRFHTAKPYGTDGVAQELPQRSALKAWKPRRRQRVARWQDRHRRSGSAQQLNIGVVSEGRAEVQRGGNA
jgi:hypothetical protein